MSKQSKKARSSERPAPDRDRPTGIDADQATDVGVNVVIVEGEISTDPILRDLPSGDVLLAFDLRVRRPGQPAQSVPISWIGGASRPAIPQKGKRCLVLGEMHRRFYRSPAGALQSRVDLRAEKIVLDGPAKRRLALRRFLKQRHLSVSDG